MVIVAPNHGSAITSSAEIIISVSEPGVGTDIDAYTLSIAPLDSDEFTELDSGSGEQTNLAAYTLDPTSLANGAYVLRLTATNEIYFIEANPNAILAEDEDFALSAGKAGLPYAQLIERIVRQGLKTVRD